MARIFPAFCPKNVRLILTVEKSTLPRSRLRPVYKVRFGLRLLQFGHGAIALVPMTDITQLLADARDGDDGALQQIFQEIYPELRRIAAARLASVRPGHTITPTVLVNETYLKLSGARQLNLVDRRHFFVCASKAMRQIIIDHARKANAQRRGGERMPITWTENLAGGDADQALATADLLDLDEALTDLKEVDQHLHDLVELKFFGGMTLNEIADLSERSVRTIKRDWVRARAFLHAQLA